MTANRLLGAFAISAISVATVAALVFTTVTAAITGFVLVLGSQAYAGDHVATAPVAITLAVTER